MLALAAGAGGGPGGGPLGLWETGTLGYVLVVLVVNLRLLLASRTLTAGHAASVAGSLAALGAYLAAYSAAPPRLLAGIAPTGAMHGVAGRLVVCPAAWLTLGLGSAAALLPDVVVVALRARGRRAHSGLPQPTLSTASARVAPDAEALAVGGRPPGLKAVKVGGGGGGGRVAIQLAATSSGAAAPLLSPAAPHQPALPGGGTPAPATPGSTPHTGYAFDDPGFESYFAERDSAGGARAKAGRPHGPASARAASDSLVRSAAAPAAGSPASSSKRRRFSAVEAIALAARGWTASTSATSSRRASRVGVGEPDSKQAGAGKEGRGA